MACGAPGGKCGAMTIGRGGYCQRHDPSPEQVALRSRTAREAARRSHEWKPDPEITSWAESIDFTTPEGRARGLTETARLVAQGGLSVGQANAIAALARAAEGRTGKPPEKVLPQLVVEVPHFGGNGQAAITPPQAADEC
jgi:hypothetical protein